MLLLPCIIESMKKKFRIIADKMLDKLAEVVTPQRVTTLFRVLPKEIRAVFAIMAGILVGKPYAGIWLAHYFLGSGKTRSLPKKFNDEIINTFVVAREATGDYLFYILYDSLPYKELLFLPKGRIPFVGSMPYASDAYYCVGSMLFWIEGEYLHYLDYYNWLVGQTWTITIFGYTFHFPDSIFDGMGREFITQGKVRLPNKLNPLRCKIANMHIQHGNTEYNTVYALDDITYINTEIL